MNIIHPELLWLLKIIGIEMTITGFFDAYKYHWQAQSIKKIKLAKGHSRKFMNAAINNDRARIFYLCLFGYIYGKLDWYLLSSSLFAIIFMLECWYIIYLYYPYRHRGLIGFKRPNILIYFINSILPNRIRRKL